ncbi:MAG: hypothetical protein HYX92_00820 [Chloroflexi bacterium]|nr:hypothetical protein [Chloroflexota bacterium]
MGDRIDTDAKEANMVYKVLSPLGEPTIEKIAGAPRLSDLNGKTVCEVWNGGFMGHVAFPIIRELLRKRYPDVKIVTYDEFPIHYTVGSTQQLIERTNTTLALARQKGCDALITGMGF